MFWTLLLDTNMRTLPKIMLKFPITLVQLEIVDVVHFPNITAGYHTYCLCAHFAAISYYKNLRSCLWLFYGGRPLALCGAPREGPREYECNAE